jgi:hypothetical protein
MAGYYIYSLGYEKFHRFVEQPSRTQLLAFARLIASSLKRSDRALKKGDPMHDWPREPGELSEILQARLLLPDWYADLSDTARSVWEGAIMSFCDRSQRKSMDFRVESDGIYWDVIELARKHHALPRDRMTDAILSHFGARPYRYFERRARPLQFGDWMPYHSMHTPEEVQKLLEELRAAEPTIRASDDEQAKNEYDEELLPAVDRVASQRRMLLIEVDT